MEKDFYKLETRVSKLEQSISDIRAQLSSKQAVLNDVRIEMIVDEIGTLLVKKEWADNNKKEAIRAAFQIFGAFNNHWPDKSHHADLQFLVLNVGKSLGIDYMPSYSAIQDWIKAFNAVALKDVYLIGKSAAIALGKSSASKNLIKYVITAAQNNDAFGLDKIKDLIQREKQV